MIDARQRLRLPSGWHIRSAGNASPRISGPPPRARAPLLMRIETPTEVATFWPAES
jgi:hypothetical protein